MLALLLLFQNAFAEQTAAEGLFDLAKQRGFDAATFLQRLLSGEALSSVVSFEGILSSLRQSILQSLSELLLNLSLPVAACLLLRQVTGAGQMDFMLNLLCALCCATALAGAWVDAQRQAAEQIDAMLNVTRTMTPIMASAAALTGGGLWSAALEPLANLCVSIIQQLLKEWGLGLCGAAAVIALSGAVSGRYGLNRLFELFKAVIHWGLGAAVFVFGGLVSMQGLLGAAREGAALKTAQIAIENLMPIIGGGLSGAAGSLMVSAGFARSAIGITGVALVGRMCLGVILRLGGSAIALKLISAAMEPLAEGAAARLIGHFGDIYEMLLAIVLCCGVMTAMIPAGFALLTGALGR